MSGRIPGPDAPLRGPGRSRGAGVVRGLLLLGRGRAEGLACFDNSRDAFLAGLSPPIGFLLVLATLLLLQRPKPPLAPLLDGFDSCHHCRLGLLRPTHRPIPSFLWHDMPRPHIPPTHLHRVTARCGAAVRLLTGRSDFSCGWLNIASLTGRVAYWNCCLDRPSCCMSTVRV